MTEPVYSSATRTRRPSRRQRRAMNRLGLLILLVAVLLAFSWYQYKRGTQPAKPTEPFVAAAQGDTITISAGGDINISDALLESARQSDGTYDFSSMLVGVAPLLGKSDLTIVNAETNFCGAPYDAANHKAPEALLEALRKAGVDLIQTSNTMSIYNGINGLQSTLDAVKQAGLTPVGTFASKEDWQEQKGFTMVEAQGFRVAFVSFTKGVGNLSLPEGCESSVNLLYKDYNTTYQEVNREGIQKILEMVQGEHPDITIALLHWGSEYDDEISKTQKEIETLMLEGGVDAIIGTHPHLVGAVKQENTALTAYSIGNLLSVDSNPGTNQGIILNLEFTKGADGTVLTDWSYDPIYLASGTETATGNYELLDTKKEIAVYETDYLYRVKEELYQSLKKSIDQIKTLTILKEE